MTRPLCLLGIAVNLLLVGIYPPAALFALPAVLGFGACVFLSNLPARICGSETPRRAEPEVR